MATFISTRTDQFTYFDQQLGGPVWAGKRVLDFGGNAGNILLDPNCRIEPHNYWCIDVSRDSIPVGRRRHPEGNFIFYDRYNFEFNPNGQAGLPVPDPGVRFDFIVAWSVITHVSQAETLDLIEQLMPLLADGGRAAFSFIDPYWTPPAGWARDTEFPGLSNLHWRLAAREETSSGMDMAGMLTRASEASLTWTTLVNDDELIFDPDDDGLSADKPPNYYITFCTPEHMQKLFPTGKIVDPVRPERFHCLVIDKADHTR
ncbi:MAG TPA: class I SAM-dependent methyltransferase [Streptosporangiaceae bacterium]